MANKPDTKVLLTIVIILVVGLAGYSVLTRPDTRSTGEKVGDAIDALPDGLDKAGRQLESRTPGEKLEDAARDAKQDVKKAVNQP